MSELNNKEEVVTIQQILDNKKKMSELNNKDKEVVTIQKLLDNGIPQEFLDKFGITQQILDQGIKQEDTLPQSLFGISKTMLEKFTKGITSEEAEQILKAGYKKGSDIFKENNSQYNYPEFDWEKIKGLDKGVTQEDPLPESLFGVSKTMLDKYGITNEEAEQILKARYKGSLPIFPAHMEYDYSGLELPKTLTEKQRVTSLVQETIDSLKGRSCYEPEILEAVKAVMYKENEPVSKTDFASALVSKLKEEGIVKHEGELSSIQKGVVAALTKIESRRVIKNN